MLIVFQYLFCKIYIFLCEAADVKVRFDSSSDPCSLNISRISVLCTGVRTKPKYHKASGGAPPAFIGLRVLPETAIPSVLEKEYGL